MGTAPTRPLPDSFTALPPLYGAWINRGVRMQHILLRSPAMAVDLSKLLQAKQPAEKPERSFRLS